MLLSIADPFIKRPVLTTVCSIIIVLLGGICIPLLPIAQLPQIAPTQVEVSTTYIGADAQTAENTVTTILEREINGVEDMRYMSSNTSSNGVTNINVTFPTDVDRNIAQVNVQNRVALAEPELPESVRQVGVTVEKSSPDLLLGIAFYAEQNENGDYLYNSVFLSNYLDLYVTDAVQRIRGVGQVTIFGERKYAMRLWLDPNALAARNLTAQDVVAAIQEQNIQVGAGSIGQQPSPEEQQYEITLRAIGRFQNEREFEDLVLEVGEAGTLIKIKDVGRVELGAENYGTSATSNGAPAVGLGIFQLPGTNALDTARAVKSELNRLSEDFPPGIDYQIGLDATAFVEVSLKEVVITLLIAIALVVLIIFVFLQDWRATIIPSVAIPVALVGTFAFLMAFSFEINTLTLFAMVLATGVVVDDAIVVVEAIATKVERGMQPRIAAIDTMNELSGAVIATSLVLMAVFIPVSFFPGSTGIIYKQFALTIVFAIVISTFNALTFSPTISGILLRRKQEARGPLGWFFGKFNQVFGWVSDRYTAAITFLTRKYVRPVVMAVFAGALALAYFLYTIVPTGFVPEEDQGYFFTIVQAPDGVSLNYTQDIIDQVGQEMAEIPEIELYFGIAGFGFSGNGSNRGFFFSRLKPWSERPDPSQSVYGVLNHLNAAYSGITGARVISVNAPPVRGLSSFGGFEFQLQERTGNRPISALEEAAGQIIGAANQRPELQGVFTQFSGNTPQIEVEVDRDRAKALNVNIDDIFATLQIYLGSSYVNDFVLGQRQYRVYAQADSEFRSNPDDINQLYVRSQDDRMVQLSNLVTLNSTTGPQTIPHYNVFRSINIQGAPASGYSTGQAIAAMEEAAAELPKGFGYEWTGTALEETSSGNQSLIIFGLAIVMAFLVLAAQYESYVDPLIIILTVPMAVLGAIGAVWLRANILQAGSVWPVINNDVYCQVGLVMLIGLASKNAILIVEYANQLREQGLDIVRAAIKAGQERFRPILMTAISSLVGFFPLVAASGAGASSRWSLGTAVFGGLLVTTLLSLFFVPTMYIVIKNLAERAFGDSSGGDDASSAKTPPKQASPQEEVVSRLQTSHE